jgi:dihydrofolate reductase/thymidylate synthase
VLLLTLSAKSFCRDSLNGPACEAIHLTDIQSDIECDTFIPPVDFSVFQPWCSSLPVVESNIRHSFVTYVRVRKSVLESHDSNGKESTENDIKSSKFEIENFSFLPKMIFERHEEYYYLNLVDDIIRRGAQKGDRTGTGTLSKFGCQVFLYFSLIFTLIETENEPCLPFSC